MAIFTSILNLLKKNPATDGADTFNIQTMLNENWDKIDAAMALQAVDGDVRVATTANITLSGLQTVDGIALVTGDRVLVKNQTTGSQNGIYVAATGAWSRAADADTTAKVAVGMNVYVRAGTANGGKRYTLSNAATVTLDTTALAFTLSSAVLDSASTAGTAVLRDANGRAQVAAPSAAADIARKDTVDAAIITAASDATTKANAVQTNLTAHIGAGGTAHAAATTSAAGFMSSTDKTKLDGIASGAGTAGSASDTVIGNRTINDTIAVGTTDTDTPTNLFSKIGAMLRAITGKADWYVAPAVSLEAVNTALNLAQAATAVSLSSGVQIVTASRRSRLRLNKLTGRTLINIMGRGGNFETLTGWGGYQVAIATDSSNFTTGKIGLKATIGSGFTVGSAFYSISMKANVCYVAVADLKNGNATSVNINISSPSTFSPNVTNNTKFNPAFFRVKPATDTVTNINVTVGGAAGQYAYADALRVYAISQAEYDAIAGMTAAQVAAMYPYVDDVKHTNALYINNPGRNLLPPIPQWSNLAYSVVSEQYKATTNTTTVNQYIVTGAIPVIPGATYTISPGMTGNNVKMFINERPDVNASANVNLQTFALTSGQASQSFTVGANTRAIIIVFGSDTTASLSFTIDSPMLVYGATAAVFEPQKPSYMYLPDAQLRSNFDGSVFDVLYTDGEGKPRATRWFREVPLDTSMPWTFLASATGMKQITTPASMAIGAVLVSGLGITTSVKYDGKMLNGYINATTADSAWIASDYSYRMAVPATDSGWGDSYTPTDAEVSSYLLGWQMGSTNGATFTTPYTGTGTKAWRGLPYTGDGGPGTQALPTAPYFGIYNPNRMIYQLTSSVDEALNYEGDLFLHDGANQIEVGTGIVVRENVAPVTFNSTQTVINGGGIGTHKLAYATSRPLAVYRNGVIDKKWTAFDRAGAGSAPSYGNYYALVNNMDFDAAAAYSISYVARDTYALGIAPQTISTEYAPSVKESLDDVTRAVMEVKRDVSVLQAQKAAKQQPQWISPTLLNGWLQYGGNEQTVGYRKTDMGYVEIRGTVKSGTIGQVVFVLPAGYRPQQNQMYPIIASNGTNDVIGRLAIYPDGSVIVVTGANTFASLQVPSFLAAQ